MRPTLSAMPTKKKSPPPHGNVYARLGISKFHGVGVFAIRAILANRRVFLGEKQETVLYPKTKIDKLEPALKKLYEDFGVEEDGYYGVPSSFNNLTIGWFVNHNAKNPNLRCGRNYEFFSKRKIQPGEELTVNYLTFNPKYR